MTNDDYLTLGVDNLPLFSGRTALQCYEDFMSNFVNKFAHLIGDFIQEISIGLGPSGELRYFLLIFKLELRRCCLRVYMEEPFTGILHILLMTEDGDFPGLVSFSAMTNICKSEAFYIHGFQLR